MEKTAPACLFVLKDWQAGGGLVVDHAEYEFPDRRKPYATFRSFPSGKIYANLSVDAFFQYGLGYCREGKGSTATGKVHVRNGSIRALYKKAGFEPTRLTMEIDLETRMNTDNFEAHGI